MTSSSTVHATSLRRHPKYYFPDASHVFQVEDTLYRLYPFILCNHSDFFADMFLAPHEASLRTTIESAGQDDLLASFQHSSGEGKSDASPMFLPDLSTATFDMFVEYHFGSPRPNNQYSNDELKAFLGLCDRLLAVDTRQFVINRIDTLKHRFHPAELIDIARSYHIPKLFRYAFLELMETPITLITGQDRELMGTPVFVSLVYAKAALERHWRIVAAEEPPILQHASECQDPASCAYDWHAIWWNGMGRFLLDGRNPQPFDDAVKRFREMNFGRVNEKCKARMLRIIDDGLAFRVVDTFLADICDDLVGLLKI